MILPPFLQRWLLLNFIRLLTIVSCSLVIASTIRTLKINFQHYPPPLSSPSSGSYYPSTDIPTSFLGVFWCTLHHISLALVLLTVVLSELSLPIPLLHRLFKNTLPFLGPNWGTGFLGVLLLLVAADGLSRGDTGKFAEASNWTLASTGVLNVIVGVVWRAKAKVVRSPMGWKRDVAEKMERLAEAKANAERVVDAVPLPTGFKSSKELDGEKGEEGGGGKWKDLLGKAGRVAAKKMDERQAKKVEERDVEKAQVEPPTAAGMSIFAPALPSAIVSSRAVPPPAPAPTAAKVESVTSSPKKTASPIPPPLIIPRVATPPQSRASTCSTRSTSSVYTLDIPPPPNPPPIHPFSTTPILTTTDTCPPSPFPTSTPSKPTFKTVRFHPTQPTLHHPSPIPSLTATTTTSSSPSSQSIEVTSGGSKFLILPSPTPKSAVGLMEGERSPSVLASLKAAMLEAQAKASAQPCKKSLYLGSTRWRAEYESLNGHDPEEKKDSDRPYDFL